MKTKSEIRKEIKDKLEKQSEIERSKKSLFIKQKLFDLVEFKEAEVVMFYVSTEMEVNTKEMIDDALKMGKKIAVPYVLKEERKLIPSLIKNRTEDLTEGAYRIHQPRSDRRRPVAVGQIDLVVVPGVAFTKDGARLGRGAGFYDRFLKELPKETQTVGIAFDLQVVEDLPQNEGDIPVKKLITNAG